MKFKPCPFCGCSVTLIKNKDVKKGFIIYCDNNTENTCNGQMWGHEKNSLINNWNTRTDPVKDRLYEALIENDARICEAIEHEENQAGNHTQDLIQIHNTTRIIIKSHEDETNDPHL